MSEFNEFDQKGSVPEKNASSIISHAFEIYKGIFLYALLAMIIYFIVDFILQSISGISLFGDFSNFKDFNEDSYKEILESSGPGMTLYYTFSGLLGILFSPIYVGLIYISNKYNNQQPIEISDLFIGFRQNLGNILLYSLITNIILGISVMLCIIPVFFVFPLFLLGYPVLLFENAKAFDAISRSYNIAKENYGIFLGAGLLGILISAAGIVLCCIGIIITLPFVYTVMYSTYCAFLGKPRQIITK